MSDNKQILSQTTPVTEAIKELEAVRDEANVMGGAFGGWVHDRVAFAIVLLKEGDNG